LQPDDYLWFFFSGYGLSDQGQDYLMTIDSKPQDCRNTALPIKFVYEYLQHCPAKRILVLLDISRQVEAEQPNVGAHTADLAQQTGIPTIIACYPGQVSQSTVALQQGLFTRSLLEALQTQQDMTPAYLEQFLRDRLPVLCELYGRPSQQVLTTCPSSLLEQPLLLKSDKISTATSEPVNLDSPLQAPDKNDAPNVIENSQPLPHQWEPALSRLTRAVTNQPEPLISLSPKGWHWFKLGVGMLAALIFSSLLLSHLHRSVPTENQAASQVVQPPQLKLPNPGSKASPNKQLVQSTTLLPTQTVTPFSSILGPAQARTLIKSDQASPFWDAIQEVRTILPDHPEYALMPQAIAAWSQDIWTIAQQRATRGEFDTAILAAALVPSDQAIYQQAKAATGQWCTLFRFNPQRNIDQQKQAAAICLNQRKLP
jgi:hypothetical protein